MLWRFIIARTKERFESHKHPQPPKEYIRKLGGLSPHKKQHYIPYYLSIVFFSSLKYAFGIISMFFTLVRCSIILSRLFLTYLHPCFFPYVQIYQISVHLLMSREKCPIWQVLFILKFGTFAFFFILYCILFKFIMFYYKCPRCHTHFFLFV
jgi:hypothetical protein